MASPHEENRAEPNRSVPGRNENYMLGHVSGGAQENRRLEVQHDAIRHGIMDGRFVHASIPMARLRGPVADVCCGTGVWLNDLARDLTAAGHWRDPPSPLPPFVGFDLTASTFRRDLAPNVRLVRHDCCQPFPVEHRGVFDLVNMRGLAYAIPEAVFGALFRNACSLLRPGGYIQWLDTESQLWTSTPDAATLTTACDLIMQERSTQRLVHYMPDFMIRQYLSLSPPRSPTPTSDRAGLSLIHFGLTPGGASRPHAADDTVVNDQFSHVVLETVRLLLEGSLLKEQQRVVAEAEVDRRDVSAIKRCIEYVVEQQTTGALTVSGHFPLLIAKKQKTLEPVISTDEDVV